MYIRSHIVTVATGFLLLLLFIVAGCSVSRMPKETWESLVDGEDPIFDRRFHNLSYQDLDVENLWTEGEDSGSRRNLAIHNNTFAEVTEAVKDGVVNIYTRRVEERDVKFGISPNDLLPIKIPLISTILDIIPFKVPIPFRTEGFSLGSGFIINEQGYILTNAHVIHNSTDIRVVLSGGRKGYPARIIGMDRLTDAALIKMETETRVKVLPLGNSDNLRMGEMVLAMGNPLGLRHSVTSGIVSAKERISPHLHGKHMDFIQTDSAINPGSSGGPLLNLYGEVVGINTALVSKAQSIGFAIPINTVKEVMPMLVLGRTERGWFGAMAVPLDDQKARELNHPGGGGILIEEIEKGSPAEKAGLRPDDIIVELNGQHLKNFLIFRRKLLGLAPEQELQLVISRNGETKLISSKLIRKGPQE